MASASDRWTDLLLRIEAAGTEADLALVAAGPLEDLLFDYGLAVIDLIEVQARRDPKFRLALTKVWAWDLDSALFARLEVAANSPLPRPHGTSPPAQRKPRKRSRDVGSRL